MADTDSVKIQGIINGQAGWYPPAAFAGTDAIAYAQKTDGAFTCASGNRIDIPNLSPLVFTVPAGLIGYVELRCDWHTAANAGASGSLVIADNSGVDASAGIRNQTIGPACYQTATTRLGGIVCLERITTPGDYVRKGQVTATGNTITYQTGSGTSGIPPLQFRAWLER